MIEPGRMTIGEKRLEYLDFGNKALMEGNYGAVEQCIKAFLKTIRTGSEVATEINKTFDGIENKKNLSYAEVEKNSESMDIQSRCEERYNALQSLGMMGVDDRLDACWQIMLKFKLQLPTSD